MIKHYLEVLADIEVIMAKSRKLSGTWTMVPTSEPRRMTRGMAWVVAGLYVASFGAIAALLLYQGWWFISLIVVGIMFNEMEKLRAVGFAGKRLAWDNHHPFDFEFPFVFSLEGESTKFKPDRYYRLLRRHRHSFYVDDAIDLPGAEPLPSMLWGPWVVVLYADSVYFCKAAP